MTDETTPPNNTVLKLISRTIDAVIKYRGKHIRERVYRLKCKYPKLDNKQIAQKIVNSRSFYSGVAGGTTSLGGLVTLPLSIGASLTSSLFIQAEMLLAVAYVYELDMDSDDRKRDLLVLMAGSGITEVLRNLGVEAGKKLTKNAVDKYFTREVMKKVWKVVGQKTLTKAGEKSTYSLMKMIPFVSAPIGFAMDYSSTRVFGALCIKYYGTEGIDI